MATRSVVCLFVVMLALWPALQSAQGQSITGSFTVADEAPPAVVTDLFVCDPSANSLTLTWTAPGDNGHEGIAAAYDIRYATSPITNEAQWAQAPQAANEPAPVAAGERGGSVPVGRP